MAGEPGGVRLPEAPIDRVIGPVARLLHADVAGGVVLLACTIVALALANSPVGDAYLHFWHTPVGFRFGGIAVEHSLEHWINDGLMAIFFFLVGLEVKREIVLGELRDPRQAVLPLVAALGGMAVPAAIYLVLQGRGPAARAWGVPMATDIAFVVGCMAVLGARMPRSLRITILTLAIADDVGAILVIAFGYSSGVNLVALGLGAVGVAAVVLLERVGVRSLGVYTLAGLFVWAAFLASGVHATIAGVILGLLTPARAHLDESAFARVVDQCRAIVHAGRWTEDRGAGDVRTLRQATRETVSPLAYVEHALHPWVAFVIMPVFALANAGVPFRADSLASPVASALAVSLLVGKTIGIVGFSWVAVRAGVARLPAGVGWGAMSGAGMLGGIGFTMALFIASLALEDATLEAAKVGILLGSAVAAVLGTSVLLRTLPVAARSSER
jgi:Na+:H+ antiporter, NhaA family